MARIELNYLNLINDIWKRTEPLSRPCIRIQEVKMRFVREITMEVILRRFLREDAMRGPKLIK